jgi:hypothetical protein
MGKEKEMNTNLLNIVKQIIAEYGEDILADSQRLKAFFKDLAKDEPKPLRLVFGRCIEVGAYNALKTASDTADRAERKTAIAKRLHDEHGLDIMLCTQVLDILDAALYGTQAVKALPHIVKAPTAPSLSYITPKNSAEKEQISGNISNKRTTASDIVRVIVGFFGIVVGIVVGAVIFAVVLIVSIYVSLGVTNTGVIAVAVVAVVAVVIAIIAGGIVATVGVGPVVNVGIFISVFFGGIVTICGSVMSVDHFSLGNGGGLIVGFIVGFVVIRRKKSKP